MIRSFGSLLQTFHRDSIQFPFVLLSLSSVGERVCARAVLLNDFVHFRYYVALHTVHTCIAFAASKGIKLKIMLAFFFRSSFPCEDSVRHILLIAVCLDTFK